MKKRIRRDVFDHALEQQGLTQKALAEAIGVSAQAVTNWLQGKDFPRPPTLLKLAARLQLTFDALVATDVGAQPVVAFRKKGSAKTTQKHLDQAAAIGELLKPLTPFLESRPELRTQIAAPSLAYARIQAAAAQTRRRLGVAATAVLKYERLIDAFKDSGAVLVPVLWGDKQRHENALHIHLPQEDATFVFLNLDTRIEDFKFWMAHELAHVYTPPLAGTDKGEDFADAFAGALLFPQTCAEAAYRNATAPSGGIEALAQHAQVHEISLNTVFQGVKQYAQDRRLPTPDIEEKAIHATRNRHSGPLVSQCLFDTLPPLPDHYVACSNAVFRSDFFPALARMLRAREPGPGYLQQMLDISIHDARTLYEALRC